MGRPKGSKTVNWTLDSLESGIKMVMKRENIEHMPTQRQVQNYSHGLAEGIKFNGGFVDLADVLGIPRKTADTRGRTMPMSADKANGRIKHIPKPKTISYNYAPIEDPGLALDKQAFEEMYPFMEKGIKIERKY